ncbi:MAG: hypothetical protein Q8S21_05915 [Candidatus Paracaedibacteraceae bacterium]|nr:hypothetical protein [Candidatus Paracaedibacteraceae bacterium]
MHSIFLRLKKALFASSALIALHVDSFSAQVAKIELSQTKAIEKLSLNDANKDESAKIISTDSKEDTAALAKMNAADNHRNNRTNFGYKEAQIEATRLYKEVMDDKAVSPDVRARAKINYADVYQSNTYINDTVTQEDRSKEALRLLNEVIHETNISADFKGWAKRHLAKLYLSNNFDMEPFEAKRKSASLLDEVCKDVDITPETRSRAKIELAARYNTKDATALKIFGITEEEGKSKAITLLNEVVTDTKARPDLRAEAKLALAKTGLDEDDFYKQKLLLAYKEVIADQTITNLMRAQTKAQLASHYIDNYSFNLKRSEASKIGFNLLQEVANDKTLPIQKRLEYKQELKWYYSYLPDLVPSEAYAKSLALALEIVEESRIDAKEFFKARVQLANDYSRNIFKQKKAVAEKESQKILKELLADTTLTTEDKIELRTDLANKYLSLWPGVKPIDGNDVKTATLALYNEILAYPDLKQEKWFKIKCTVANMYLYHTEVLNIKKSDGKAESLRLYNELLENKKITSAQKKKIYEAINLIEKDKVA